MKRFKQMVLRTFLVVEVIIFGCTYIFGSQGLRAMWYLKDECLQREQTLDVLRADIARLESDIEVWQSDPFYKEKIAREQLGMARSDEMVFITNKDVI